MNSTSSITSYSCPSVTASPVTSSRISPVLSPATSSYASPIITPISTSPSLSSKYLEELEKQKQHTDKSKVYAKQTTASQPKPIEALQKLPIEILQLICWYVDNGDHVRQVLSLGYTELPKEQGILRALHERLQEEETEKFLKQRLPWEPTYQTLCFKQLFQASDHTIAQDEAALNILQPAEQSIHAINLSNTQIPNSDLSIQKLSLLFKKFTRITELNLSNCNLWIEKIPLDLIQNLTKINLSRNNTRTGIETIKTNSNGTLTELDVSQITQTRPLARQQLQMFVQKFPNLQSLKILHLPYQNVTFFEDIAKLKKLQHLTLCDTVQYNALRYTELNTLESLRLVCAVDSEGGITPVSASDIELFRRAMQNLKQLRIVGYIEKSDMPLLLKFPKLTSVAIRLSEEDFFSAVKFEDTDTMAQRAKKLNLLFCSVDADKVFNNIIKLQSNEL